MRIQKIEDKFGIVFSPEAMEALHLREGVEVEVQALSPDAPVFEFISDEQALEHYRATLPEFRADYEELAK